MSKTILCADDSATMQTVAEITFRATDYSYVGARSVDDALEKAKKEKPAVVLADALMGDKSGYDLCKAIKSEPSLADVPVIVMCGNSEAYDEAKGSAAGADGHVTKPWDTQKLIDQLNEIVEKAAGGAAKPAAAAAVAAPAAKPAAAPPAKPATPPAAAAKAPTPPAQPPRSPTLMGMPSLQMPPAGARNTPAGVTPITPPSQAAKTPAPEPTKPASPAPVATAPAAAGREPMIAAKPTKPIRLVLASQAESAATQAGQGAGLDASQAEALTQVSRELLEAVVWEVVPQLAEAIIRENLETLTSKAR